MSRDLTTQPLVLALLGLLFVPISASTRGAERLPVPGNGIFFRATEVAALRDAIQRPPVQAVYQNIVKQADAGLARWADDKTIFRLAELAPKLPDLTMELVPKEFAPQGGKEAGKILEEHASHGAASAAFVFLMTGERRYADYAWQVFELCSQTNRWGWFPWSGSHMPQIHFGIVSRNLCLIADCIADTLTPAQRTHAREVIAEKCVEPYFRIVLHTPGMGLYHLRSRNQGSNALAAALIGSLFVGDAVPDNDIWFRSLLQTFHWAITHDIGWMGQNLESGMPGYWSVSMQNLYTAAAALHNVRGIDLRAHPGFAEATWYPFIHQSTVPPVGMFSEPLKTDAEPGLLGVISGKPIELPHEAYCGAWWFDYAANFPHSPARYFVSKFMTKRDRGTVSLLAADAHQGALSDVLKIAWWNDRLLDDVSPPASLALFTDRMAGVRSGWRFGDTYLYFNGDLFLSAKKEILATTSGLSWHFPWHQYQITESGIETEGEPFAPSMSLRETSHNQHFTFFRAAADFSNVAYYPQPGQRESHRHYERRDRSVLYVRGDARRPDYFLFLDDVRQAEPRWHAWTWHLWNSPANPANFGRFTPQGSHAVRAERPNADLWIQFLEPGQEVAVRREPPGAATSSAPTPDGSRRSASSALSFEQHGIPSQPMVSYQMDHHAQMLRAIVRSEATTPAKPLTIPLTAWQNLGVERDAMLFLDKPPTDKRITGHSITGITGGARYRWSLRCKEEDYRVYEATAWAIELELLDAAGHVVAKPQSPYGHPDPLRLGAPLSDKPTHDWTETVQYFDAPENAVACRASFFAVGGAHYFQLGKLWLRPIELEPVPLPARTTEQRFLTLVMPLDKGAAPPRLEPHATRPRTTLVHPDGSSDVIALSPDGKLSVTRYVGPDITASFPAPANAPNTAANALQTNSDENARLVAAGLAPVLRQLDAERDALTRAGRTNLAVGAKVTASATLDARFVPERVVDGNSAEYPLDGHLDYRLGIVWSSGRFVGYGAGKESLLANRDYWPLYVRPMWWLLPEETLGHLELTLAKPATVDTVRLLNTSNAGLNDFATHTFRVELYDGEHKLLASRDGAFGKVFDRPFQQAFINPPWFRRYTPSFTGMLEPGLTVPFGDGWQTIRFPPTPGVSHVRIVVTKYWGIGGGLNEVQVYATEK